VQPYRKLFSLSWQKFLSYRLNFFLHALIVLISALAYLFLWQSVTNQTPSIGSYSGRALMTYLVGALFFNGIVSFGAAGDQVDDEIRRGELNRYLVQPLPALGAWLTTDLARHSLRTLYLLGTLGVLVALFNRELLPPIDLWHALAAIASVGLAYGIIYHWMVSLALASFWLTDSWSVRFGFRIVAEFGTGAFIPLTLFPSWLQTICFALPFKFLAYIPMQLYLGRLTATETTRAFLEASLWLVALVGLTNLIWRRGLRRYEGVGV
jgi:ABC-2 type transport system permease protein